ncbi:MAG TPA: hypothetical protein VIT93_07110 [Dehalococcoidia bacterium]
MLGVRREDEAITVRFAAEALATLEAFVEAERQCCAGTGWTVTGRPDVTMRIAATPTALDAFAIMFKPEDIEDAR